MKRVAALLITLALIAAMVGCPADPVHDPEPEPDPDPDRPVQYVLAISSSEGGEVAIPGEGSFTYDEGTVVSLVEEAETGYRFVRWTGDVEMIADVNAASTTITMDSDYTVSPNFAKVPAQSPNWAVVGAIGGVVLVVGLLVFYLLRRRRA